MKKHITSAVLSFIAIILFSQAPEKFSYQAVVRDNNGDPLANKSVSFQISILSGSGSGTAIYTETHSATSSTQGIVTLQIGGGTTSGNFSAINWSSGKYYLKVEMDAAGGTNYALYSTSQLVSVPYAMHASTADSVTGKLYSIGDFAQGGVVFWVDETGQHGLVCAKTNQSTSMRWYAGTNGITRAVGNGLYAGKSNTAIIVAAQIAIGDDGNDYAASICNELEITEDEITYGDWYLPSQYELNIMRLNQSVINSTSVLNGGTVLDIALFWSSTETSSGSAYYITTNFLGSNGVRDKNTAMHVRAIRSF